MSKPTPPAKSPSPGSAEAIKAGCTCPVLDNSHGKGYMRIAGIFVMNESCPLHGTQEDAKP